MSSFNAYVECLMPNFKHDFFKVENFLSQVMLTTLTSNVPQDSSTKHVPTCFKVIVDGVFKLDLLKVVIVKKRWVTLDEQLLI
jgi:hypothetical protein